jgi:hypothetical protein
MKKEKGTRRTVWLPADLDAKAEELRRALGLGRSGFYRYAVTRIVESTITNTRRQGNE